MKKIHLLLASVLLLFNCSNDVTFNSPAFQGSEDGTLWRASGYSASIDEDGFLTITGNTSAQTMSLTVPYVDVRTFTLGDVPSMEAKVEKGDGTVYLAINDGTAAAHLGDGEIVIEEIGTNNGAASFTGTFWFNAFSTGDNSINFTEGVFYKIPLVSGSIPDPVYTCVDAQTESAAALANYEAAANAEFVIREDFETTCATYKLALENERVYCGDLDGSIEEAITALGDCLFTCEMAQANSVYAAAQYNGSTIGNALANCLQYMVALNEEIELCGDPNGDLSTLKDTLYNCEDSEDNDGIPMTFESHDPNGDGDLTDAQDTDDDSIPDYRDSDDDGDGILTVDEIMADDDGVPLDSDDDGTPNYLDSDS